MTSVDASVLIPLNQDYESKIFNSRNITPDCRYIELLMYDENDNIKALAMQGNYFEAALRFLQLAKSMCIHFVTDEHCTFFDDSYGPEYALGDLTDFFQNLIDNGTLPENVRNFLLEGWKEIEHSECYQDYGIPTKGVVG